MIDTKTGRTQGRWNKGIVNRLMIYIPLKDAGAIFWQMNVKESLYIG